MNNTITIKYANGSMEINLEAWTDYKPTKAEIRRVYKLAAESDERYNTTVIDEVQTFIRVNGDSKSKTYKALAEVFGVSLGIKAETPKKATKKDFVFPEYRNSKFGVYLLAIPADIYTYKGIKYGIYKNTGNYSGYTLVEYSTGVKINGGNKE